MSLLTQLAAKYKIDKLIHGYIPIYERMLSGVDILEIGVHEGGSLKMWREYFEGRVVGVDIQLIVDKIEGVHLIQADASKEFDKIPGTFDVIIDDGSHFAHEQLASFYGLWDRVNPGGWYVVEDLFATYNPVWNDQSAPNMVTMIADRMKSILIGGDSIQEVHYFGRNDINGIMFLRKRSEPFRIQPLSEFQ